MGMDRPKAAVSLLGRTLLERAVDTCARAAERVLVVAPDGMALPDVPAPRVSDSAEGPLGGVLAGVRALGDPAGAVVVLGVDFPLIRAETLRWFTSLLGSRGAVLAAPSGTWQPLAAVYASTRVSMLERRWVDGERSIMRAVEDLHPAVVDDGQLAGVGIAMEEFMNVNTTDDLKRAEALLGRPTA